MAGAAHRVEGETPNSQHQRVIECWPTVLDEIRETVLERFNRIPHGGPEVFGVLFGAREGGEMRIMAFRPLRDERGLAGQLALTDEDRAAFAAVQAVGSSGEFGKLEPVGWFRAHPRCDLTLSERDREIFDSLFPHPWQVALVLRPGNSTPSRSRIFFREPGSRRPENQFREFIREAAEPVFPKTEALPEEPAVSGEVAEAGPVSPAENAVVEVRSDSPADGTVEEAAPVRAAEVEEAALGPVAWHEDVPDQLPAVAAEAAEAAEEPLPAPVIAPKPMGRAVWLWAAALVAAASIAIAIFWTARSPKLALGLLDSAGQLRITWNGEARALRRATAAHLEITDGIEKVWLELDREQLRGGNVTYTRRSSNVTVRLKLERPGAAPVEETARFVGDFAGGSASGRAPGATGSASRFREPADTTPELVVSVPVEPVTEPVPQPRAPAGKVLLPPKPAKSTAPEMATPPEVSARNVAPASIPASPHLGPPPESPAVTRSSAPDTAGSGNSRSSAGPVQLSSAQNNTLRPPTPLVSSPEQANTAPANHAPAVIPPPVVENTVRAPAVARAPATAASGRLIWTGRLKKNQILTISGKTCSTGTVMGQLPGKPIRFSVSPGDLSSQGLVLYTSNLQYANNVVEPPSAENGWNQTTYTWNPRYANDVTIEEAPGPQNAWSRIGLRAKSSKLSVIVIDWNLVN